MEHAKVKPKLPTLWAWESFEQKRIELKDSLFTLAKKKQLLGERNSSIFIKFIP